MELSNQQWTLVALFAGLALGLYVAVLLTFAISRYGQPATGGGDGGGSADVSGWLHTLQREPVRVRVALLAILAVAGSFGLQVSDERQAVIVAAVLAVLAMFAKSTRDVVTPVAAPVVEKGVTVKRI